MDDLQLIRSRLAKTPDNELYALAQDSGVPYGTLWNLKNKTKNPRFETVKALADFYKAKAA